MRQFRLRTVFLAGLAVGLVLAASTTSAAELVSVNTLGTDSGNGASAFPQINDGGRFIAFHSLASDLVSNDANGAFDVFLRDIETGTTTLISANRDGTDSGDSNSFTEGFGQTRTISADGRYVVFASFATDLVAGITVSGTIRDTFVRDVQTGTTTLVSINQLGTAGGNRESGSAVISADGRYVAFRSFASNLVATDTNETVDVFVHDLQTGTTQLVSVNQLGTNSGNGFSSGDGLIGISANGQIIAFDSIASDLVSIDNNGSQIFVRDILNNITTLASVSQDGTASGNNGSDNPRLSDDGCKVVFESFANNLVADTNFFKDVFVRDICTGATELVSVAPGGLPANSASDNPVISPNGRFVAFRSGASNLATASDTNLARDVYVRDLQLGVTHLVSVNQLGTSGNAASARFSRTSVGVSDDGRVVFRSQASDLVASDSNGRADVFLRDISSGTTTILSANAAGTDGGDSDSGLPLISSDGSTPAFQSFATDLVSVDSNGTGDIFVSFDLDGDSIFAPQDNCLTVFNPDQLDVNMDGFGDACVSTSADIAPDVMLGDGVVIGDGATVNKGASVGDNSVIGAGSEVIKNASVGDNVIVGDDVVINKNVTIGNNVCIGDRTVVNKDTTIGDGTTIGTDGVIGNAVQIAGGIEIGNNVTIPNNSVINTSQGGPANCPS